MNQEKLAKLQAQVRIGGKVQSAPLPPFIFFLTCIVVFLVCYTGLSDLGLIPISQCPFKVRFHLSPGISYFSRDCFKNTIDTL